MTADPADLADAVGALIALALAVYMLAAILFPERF